MNIAERAKRICLSPDTEWPVIAAERTSLATLLTSYVLPLAGSERPRRAGRRRPGESEPGRLVCCARDQPGDVHVWVVVAVSIIIDALAPTFGAEKSSDRAAKVAAYSPTPAWIAGRGSDRAGRRGLIALIGALYALYILYLGLLRVDEVPAGQGGGLYRRGRRGGNRPRLRRQFRRRIARLRDRHDARLHAGLISDIACRGLRQPEAGDEPDDVGAGADQRAGVGQLDRD